MDDKVFFDAADEIWENPETGLEEFNTQKVHKKLLINAGFDVEVGIAGLQTSYVATWGKGSPVIAFIAEMDALDGMSQIADSEIQEPIKGVSAGHGCAHHLLGVGAIAAGIKYKEYLEKNNLDGTIKVFGCPLEETGSGKAYIAREGYFNECDCAFSWHPSWMNLVSTGSLQTCIQIRFKFTGKASHAAVSPQDGRSALDAMELMNVGCNYLREHMMDTDRIHYAIVNAGGTNPGVVQPEVEERYFVRSENNIEALDLMTRVIDCAKGAATMTGTKMEFIIEDASSNMITNDTLQLIMQDVFDKIELPEYTNQDIVYANKYYDKDAVKQAIRLLPQFITNIEEIRDDIKNSPVATKLAKMTPQNFVTSASSDVGDVSWNTPTVVLTCACFTHATDAHSWVWVAEGKSGIAHKGMMTAAKVLAETAIMLHENPKRLKEVRDEFLSKTKDVEYKTPLPAKVPIDLLRRNKDE